MRRPTPIDNPVEFTIDEVFFSTTDSRGVILSGNDVFSRVSGYSKPELIKMPHSIIRHPDMPRAAFKLAWDHLKAGKFFVAYVKNMAKDGRYYWVLATILPIENGYLSIRLKPSTPVFGLMPTVYKAMLDAEARGGMEAAAQVLGEILISKGFADYEAFMTYVLVEELKAREAALKEAGFSDRVSTLAVMGGGTAQSPFQVALREILASCESLIGAQGSFFADLQALVKLSDSVQSKSTAVSRKAGDIRMISFNASVQAARLGQKGITLAAMASGIQVQSDEIQRNLGKFESVATKTMTDLQELVFQTASAKLQVAMIRQYLLELTQKAAESHVLAEDLKEIQENTQSLIQALVNATTKAKALASAIDKNLAFLREQSENLTEIFKILEVMRKVGNMESAHLGQEGDGFLILFTEMVAAVTEARKDLEEFSGTVSRAIDSLRSATRSQVTTAEIIGRLENLARSAHDLAA